MIRTTNRLYTINQEEVKEALCLAFKSWDIPAPSDYRLMSLVVDQKGKFEISWTEEIPAP